MEVTRLLKLLVLLSVSLVIQCKTADKPIDLNEDNWQDILEGEWMVEFMAPWCPACRSFKETWDEFAKWGKDLDVNVGVIDVTENPGLSGRFFVTALPSIYYVRDGVFRQYHGSRKETDLISFVDDKKWRDVEPVSGWFTPNSFQMATVGLFFKAAMVIRAFYTTMTTEYGIPEWGCYLIFAVLTIVTGLLLGLLIVCCCDVLFPPRHEAPPVIVEQDPDSQDKDKDDESDILDDTKPEDKEDENHDDENDDDDNDDSSSKPRRRRPQKAD